MTMGDRSFSPKREFEEIGGATTFASLPKTVGKADTPDPAEDIG